MRVILAIVIAITLLIIAVPSALAGGKAGSNTSSWVADFQQANGPIVPSGSFIAPRHRWYRAPIQSNEGFPLSRDQRWYNTIGKNELKHRYVFNENSKYREVHFNYIKPDGAFAAVPEPGSLIGLAGPALGTLLYFRRRRTC